MSLFCSVNDAVNVLPCSTLPGLTLTVDPSQPALPCQDDARLTAAPRLRTWWLLPRLERGSCGDYPTKCPIADGMVSGIQPTRTAKPHLRLVFLGMPSSCGVTRRHQARGASGDEDEFSADVAGLADAVGLGGAVEREGLHLDHQLVLCQQLGDLRQSLHGLTVGAATGDAGSGLAGGEVGDAHHLGW